MQQKKILLLTFIFILSALSAHARLPVRIENFPLSDVRLTESPFKQAQDMDIRYLLALDPDRLLAPFLKEAGLSPKAGNYTNWENTGLDGHIGGHYLSALSCMYASTGNEEIKSRLEYMLSELKRCQDASGDGYLCGAPGGRVLWREISEGKIDAGAFSLNKKWVPLYNIHKTYAGLRDAYLHTGNTEAKEMLVKLADWMIRLVSGLSDEQIQEMLHSEHGGLNETFADVASITDDWLYLKLAHQFSHQQVLQPLLQREDRLTGMHANTQIPKVIGFKRIADMEGNEKWSEAARFFWETVVHHRSVSIGGNSVREHFHPANDFSSMLQSEQGVETCNTYNMLRLTKMLYQTDADVSYMDYYERALYNHILSTQNSVQGGFVYFTPMRSGHYRVYSRPQTGFWCCVGSGMENHARYGEMIYGHKDSHLYVNLFIPSTLRWGEVNIEQQTCFPDEEATTLVIHPDRKGRKFSVHFRLPEWTEQKELRLSVNGKSQKITVENGYITLNRAWKKGDRVRLEMPMHLRAIALPDGSANYSLLYGPVVLASKLGTQNQDGMFADDSRGGHIAGGPRLPLQNMPVIVGNKDSLLSHLHRVEDKPLTFTLKGVYPESYGEMILEPFFRLHECRYMVYWPLLSEQELQTRQELLAKEEKERAALDALTADRVTCGEQQPESDHFIQMENSRTGSDGGMRWRETGGWFSYRMKTNGKPAIKVRITFRPEKGLDARVEVNSHPLGILMSEQPDGVAIQEFEIPEVLRSNDSLEVRIGTVNSTVTPHLYEVRVMVDM
ncbi:MAG: glycoside hydrolase family 127 protein [Tannerella sp.]|jgi:DUF1680 family protein|nr:glycoside hydrolase family 127 protein [Tannerella sp.]